MQYILKKEDYDTLISLSAQHEKVEANFTKTGEMDVYAHNGDKKELITTFHLEPALPNTPEPKEPAELPQDISPDNFIIT